jgi:hypothetical protein
MKKILSLVVVLLFAVVLNAQTKVIFQAQANGKYVTIVDGQLVANADNESDATVFTMTNFNSCQFKTEDGKCIVLNEDKILVVSEQSDCTPEGFKFSILEESPVEINSMQSSEGKFVCADLGLGGVLYCNRDAVQAWEKFVLIFK